MESIVDDDGVVASERYGAGEVILFPGTPRYLYHLREGLVRLHTVDRDGNGLTLRYVKPDGFFGEEAIAGAPGERRYYAEAVTGCEVEVIDPERLPEATRAALTAYLARVVQGLYLSLFRLGGMRLRARIAAELLELRDSALASLDEEGRAVVKITHDDLAAAVGSVRETVTKVIGELSRQGAIDAGYGRIALLDVELLEQLAGQ